MNHGYPKNCAFPTKFFDQKWLWRSYRGLDGGAGDGSGDVEGSKYSLRGAVDGSSGAVEGSGGTVEDSIEGSGGTGEGSGGAVECS